MPDMPLDEMSEDIMDSAPCGFICFTDKGDIVKINKNLLQYLDYHSGECALKNIEQILTLSSRIFYQTHFYPLVKLQGKVSEIFLTLSSKDKKEIPVLVNAVRKEENNSFLIYCILMQVSQRGKYEAEIINEKQKAEDALLKNEELIKAKHELELHKEDLDRKLSRLEQTNGELIQFHEVISHDLQEPLRKIHLFTDMLFRDKLNIISPNDSYGIERIKSSCNRIRQIIWNLDKLVSLVVEDKNIVTVDLNEVLVTVKKSSMHPLNVSLTLLLRTICRLSRAMQGN